jgi:uncharacterized membrane protein YkvA (DUF1232 family)
VDFRKPLAWARGKLGTTAKTILRDPKKLESFASSIQKKLNSEYFKKTFKTFWSDLVLLSKMLKDTATGKYKPQSKKNMFLIVLGFLYFVSPLDLIPDLLVGGFLDDAAVLAWIVAKVDTEIQNYKASTDQNLNK